MLDVLLILFGLFALFKGEFRVSHNRIVRGDVSRTLGVLMLVSVGIDFALPEYGLLVMIGALVVTIVVGLAAAQKTEVQSEEQE